MNRILILTFNDAPSGIYSGQVIDVCRFLKKELNADVDLCAFISMRGFSENKERIKKEWNDAIVRRMFPKARNWRKNLWMLRRVVRKKKIGTIIARGPFAADLALALRSKGLISKVIFDARGAYVAELEEYNVVPDEAVKSAIHDLEKKAVLDSDGRIAVSAKLVEYWKERFGFTDRSYEIIPCTLHEGFHQGKNAAKMRSELGVKEKETLIVFSGSSAGWQSLNDASLITDMLRKNEQAKFLFLVNDVALLQELKNEFPGRVLQRWVEPSRVSELLEAADHGWMVREQTITNKVASPVKFAEYLAAGLKIIISDGLGDYTEFVKAHDAGIVLGNDALTLQQVPEHEKNRMKGLAREYFTKKRFRSSYKRLLE